MPLSASDYGDELYYLLTYLSYGVSCACAQQPAWGLQSTDQNQVRKRGIAQRDGRAPLFHRRLTFVAACENLVTVTTGVDWDPA